MILASEFLEKGFLLFLLVVSPAISARLSKETRGEEGNELDSQEESSWEFQSNLQAQFGGFEEILEKLRSFDQFMTRMNGAAEKLNELYAFLPLLQQLSKERLEREQMEQQRLEQQRLEQQQKDQQPLEQEGLKSELTKFPRAKLYTGKNLTGSSENYNFNNNNNSASHGKSGCHRLQIYSGQIKSIDTEGTCVRLFQICDCIGWSQAFYPGMDGNAVDSKLGGVRCIGPCSPNELDGAEMVGSSSELKVRKRENGVPDLIGDWWTLSHKRYFSSTRTSTYAFSLGVGNRVEGVKAMVYPKHLRTPEEAEQVRTAGRHFTNGGFQLNDDREEVGFAIPLELGGVSDEAYNVFLQDKAGAVKYREAFVPVFKEFLHANPSSSIYLELRFLYDNSTERKPRGIWYQYWLRGPISGYLFN